MERKGTSLGEDLAYCALDLGTGILLVDQASIRPDNSSGNLKVVARTHARMPFRSSGRLNEVVSC